MATEARRETHRRYFATEQGQAALKQAVRKYQASPKAKARWEAVKQTNEYKARVAANNAVRSGRLIRQPCEGCGTTVRVQKHHHLGYDPEHWLDVRWLCTQCHANEHLSS